MTLNKSNNTQELTTKLENISEVKRVLVYCMGWENYSNQRQQELVQVWCKKIENKTEPKFVRQMIVYALWRSEFHNYEMAFLLNVNVKTIGRDLAEIKDNIDPFWRIRGKTPEDIIKKYSNGQFDASIRDFWNRTLN